MAGTARGLERATRDARQSRRDTIHGADGRCEATDKYGYVTEQGDGDGG